MTVAQNVSHQVLRAQTDPAFTAWLGLLRAHGSAVRSLSGELQAEHGLTVADYEALLHLASAEDQQMRRIDLAGRLLLTPSGITRLLQGLEEAGLVEKGVCPGDARVTYAVLTDTGREKLAAASCSHLASVKLLFEGSYDEGELATLADLLGRLPGGDGSCPGACGPLHQPD